MESSITKKILDILLNSQSPVPSSDLAFMTGVSEKTVLKYLNFLKQDLKNYDSRIEIKQGSGSYLVIENKDAFALYLKRLEAESLFSDPQKRNSLILTKLLTTNTYINIYDLASELYVSPSSLRYSLKEISSLISKYNLKLAHSHALGYKITGSETDIRSCLVKECKQSMELSNSFFKHSSIDTIQEIVHTALEHFGIAISSSNANSLALHFMIAINRTETQNTVNIEDSAFLKDIRSTTEYFVCNYIAKKINEALTIKLPENEITYLAIHLTGKQRIYGHEQLQVNVNPAALVFYNKFLRNIYQTANIDFFDDQELRVSLLNHIVPFLNRIENDNQIRKTEIPNIRMQFPYAYELSLCGLKEIKDIENITNAEISYFALHIALSLEKRKTGNEKINVALICDEVSSIFHILSYKLTSTFDNYINAVHFINQNNVDRSTLSNYGLVLNTTNNPYDPLPNMLHVSTYLTSEDMHIIEKYFKNYLTNQNINILFKESLFFNISADSMKDELEKQVSCIRQTMTLPENFLQKILEREEFESTEYDNKIALPHPLPIANCPSFISIAKLDKPIIWSQKQVQLVFLISVQESASIFSKVYERINHIISNPDVVQELLSAKDYSEFISVFFKF